jgi:hypothetical protein
MATGGDLIEATYSNADTGNGRFSFMATEDGTFDLGGLKTQDDVKVDGSGAPIYIMHRKPWMVEGTIRWDLLVGNDLSNLQDLSASTKESDWTFSHVSGTVWTAKGKPVGDITGNTGQATAGFKITGGGLLSKIG